MKNEWGVPTEDTWKHVTYYVCIIKRKKNYEKLFSIYKFNFPLSFLPHGAQNILYICCLGFTFSLVLLKFEGYSFSSHRTVPLSSVCVCIIYVKRAFASFLFIKKGVCWFTVSEYLELPREDSDIIYLTFIYLFCMVKECVVSSKKTLTFAHTHSILLFEKFNIVLFSVEFLVFFKLDGNGMYYF